MRSLFVAILLVALVAVTNAGREKRKTFGAAKHGVHPHQHKRLSHKKLDGHKPVGESPHTVYKDEWLKMTRYSKTKSAACKQKCGKHQICLVDQTTGQTECFSRRNFREGRRLFASFRNRDAKGLKKSVEDYSKHHQNQKPEDEHKHPQKGHRVHHQQHNSHKNHHEQHNSHKDHHKQHKDLPQHNKVDTHPHVQAQHVPVKGPAKGEDSKHNQHVPDKDDHKTPGQHPDHGQHQKHPAGHQQKQEIVHNHSGPHGKKHEALELHAKLAPNAIHGHVVSVGEDEARRALHKKVSIQKSDVQKAAIKRLMSPKSDKQAKHKKARLSKSHRKGHKGHHHKKHHGKPSPMHHKGPKHACTKKDFEVMSKRLTDWFALLHARREEKNHLKIPIHKHDHKCDCQETAVWALHQFDLNGDIHLNHTELKHLETNQNEPCLKPFIKSCDHNLDSILSRKEWCCCFAKTQPPCLQRKQSLAHHHLLGAFSPRCDETGYYQKEQCHTGTGYCWCVDLNGNEIPNTRAMRKANCEKLNVMGYKKKN